MTTEIAPSGAEIGTISPSISHKKYVNIYNSFGVKWEKPKNDHTIAISLSFKISHKWHKNSANPLFLKNA